MTEESSGGSAAPRGAGGRRSPPSLVLRGGKPLYGDEALVTALGATGCDPLGVCGASKAVCLASEIGKGLPQLTLDLGASMYEAFWSRDFEKLSAHFPGGAGGLTR